jgi:hypothetical protein
MRNKRFLIAAAALLFSVSLPGIVGAASLNQAGLEIDRLAVSTTPGSLFVSIKFNTTAGVSKVALCFATGFTVAAGSPTVSTASLPNTPSTTALPTSSSLTAASASGTSTACPTGAGSIVVSNVGTVNNTSLYGFYVTTPNITNPSSAGQYNNYVSSLNGSSSPLDTTTTPTYITTAGGDQVTVTASVAPNFSFSLSSTVDNAATPADPTTSQDTTGVTMQVATNSPLGYTAYVKSGQSFLSSTNTSTHITTGTFNGVADTITHPTTVNYGFIPSTGTPATTATGTLVYDGEFSDGAGGYITAGNKSGSFNGTNFASFVSRQGGYTSGDSITLKERVSVDSSIGYANNYTDTLTIVAAGNF